MGLDHEIIAIAGHDHLRRPPRDLSKPATTVKHAISSSEFHLNHKDVTTSELYPSIRPFPDDDEPWSNMGFDGLPRATKSPRQTPTINALNGINFVEIYLVIN